MHGHAHGHGHGHAHHPGTILDDHLTHAQYLAHQRARRRAITRDVRRAAIGILAAGGTGPLLEIGVGPAVGLGMLADALGTEEATGVDADPRMIELAKAEQPRFAPTLVVADAQKVLPVADGTIGAIYSELVLHHIDDPAAVFANAYRALRPGGVFFLSDVDPENAMSRAFTALYPLLVALGFSRHGFLAARHSLTMARPFGELVDMMRAAGFEIVHEERRRIRGEAVARKPAL
ncbi:class I SAM-dependent methyltransferase [bacterium]|nr:class I SAM-dependent methyltransferase [bacterium]